jgi:hypothetical protein
MVGPSVSLADPRHWLVALENHPPVAYYVPCCSLDLSFLQPFFSFSILHEYYYIGKVSEEKREKKNSNESFVITLFFSLSHRSACAIPYFTHSMTFSS